VVLVFSCPDIGWIYHNSAPTGFIEQSLVLSYTVYWNRPKNRVYLDENGVHFGEKCSIFSEKCDVFGEQCSIFGEQCSIFGEQCDVFGE